MDQALKINPKYGEAYATAAHFFVINRRYDEGIEYYRKALRLDPSSVERAQPSWASNLMRFGQERRSPPGIWKQAYNAGYQRPGDRQLAAAAG